MNAILPDRGRGVFVGVGVRVGLGVDVGVLVGPSVGVGVGVLVRVGVPVAVADAAGVFRTSGVQVGVADPATATAVAPGMGMTSTIPGRIKAVLVMPLAWAKALVVTPKRRAISNSVSPRWTT
ncbi:MAG: hypothetical protein P8189_07435 [Anaerolineae bacterium]